MLPTGTRIAAVNCATPTTSSGKSLKAKKWRGRFRASHIRGRREEITYLLDAKSEEGSHPPPWPFCFFPCFFLKGSGKNEGTRVFCGREIREPLFFSFLLPCVHRHTICKQIRVFLVGLRLCRCVSLSGCLCLEFM